MIIAITNDQREQEKSRGLNIDQCAGCTGKCLKTVRRWVIPQQHGVKLCPYGAKRYAAAQAHIPPRYIGKTFDDYEVTADNAEAVKIAKWYVKTKPAKNLYLYGECGTGKTMLAAIMAQEMQACQFANVPELIDALKATFDTGGTETLLKSYGKCPLLILDDLGAGKITDWHTGILYQIINDRYNANLPLIVTSNCDFKDLEKQFTRRIASRLSENTVKAFFGTSDRRRQ